MKRKSVNSNFPKANLGFGDQRGMTLIELLIGIVVITVSFLAISGGQMASFTSLDKSVELKNAKTFAARILEDKYQDLISGVLNDSDPQAKFDEYVDCTKTDFADINGEDTEGSCYGKDAYEDYSVKWRLSSEKENGYPLIDLEGLVLLEIKVDWTENGEEKSFSLANYLSCVYVITQENSNICPEAKDPLQL